MKITICGIAELSQHYAAGVTHVLSILNPGWPDPIAFADFSAHRRIALRFHDVIASTPAATEPTAADVAALLEYGCQVAAEAGPEAHLLIHCHAGVSRSTAAAALLLAQAEPQLTAAAVFDEIACLRPRAWPNLLLLEYGDAALGRRGELVAAVAAQYRRVLAADPQFGTYITESGRGREVELATSGEAHPG